MDDRSFIFRFATQQPKPVVDGIKESEKFGNNGEQLQGVKTAVTSVMSVVSNFVNALVDVRTFITFFYGRIANVHNFPPKTGSSQYCHIGSERRKCGAQQNWRKSGGLAEIG
jgi:hypothetical protein